MRVKSRKPPAENLITSLSVTRPRWLRGVDDVVGDEMRHVAGDGEHEVVVLRVHDLDVGPARAPERGQLVDRGLVGALRRSQDAPAAVEQVGEAGFGAGMLGAGDGMAGDEMHALGHVGPHVAQHRALDRADVGQDGARAQVRTHRLRERAAGADGRAEDHEVGAARRLRRRRIDRAHQAQPQRGVARLLALRMADDGARQPAPPHGVGERRPDQPDADQRHALEHRRRHDRPRKLASAATTLRLSSDVPMVMRRQWGRP